MAYYDHSTAGVGNTFQRSRKLIFDLGIFFQSEVRTHVNRLRWHITITPKQVWETLFRGAEVCRRRRMMAGMWISRFCHGRVTGSLGWKFIACYKITGGHTTLIAQNQTLRSHASSLIQRV